MSQQRSDEVWMNVVRVYAKVLCDGDDDVQASTYWVVEYAVADEQAENGAVVVDAWGVVLVDDVQVWTAPPVERERVQVKQLHEQGRVLIEQHFPVPLGFLELMELHQTVEIPGPLEPVQGMASGPALPTFLATANQVLLRHSHQ